MTPEQVIARIAEVANTVGWQAGIGGSETAGMIVSCLAKRPELIERFLKEGSELIIEGEIGPENGCLTFHRKDGKVTTPEQLRISRTVKRLEHDANR